MNRAFLRWWLAFCLSLAMAATAYYFGFFHELWVKDASKISFAILALYVFQSGYTGYAEWAFPRGRIDRQHHESVRERSWYYAAVMTQLGMIGTVAGFILALAGLDADIGQLAAGNIEKEAMVDTLVTMSQGMAVALYTTLVGLVCSLLLKATLVAIRPGR